MTTRSALPFALFAFALFAFALAGAEAGAQRGPVQQGLAASAAVAGAEALQRHELARADSDFRAAMTSDDPVVRAAGIRGAALLRWRYHGDFAAAARLLATSDPAMSAADRAAGRLALARLQRASGRYADALRSARLAADSAAAIGEPDLGRDAAREMVLAATEPVLVERVDGGSVRQRVSAADLRDAVDRLAAWVRASPGRADDSHALLAGAVAAGQGGAALIAWRSYFFGDAHDPRFPALAGADRELARLLPSWHGEGSPSLRARIVAALSASRMYEAAALVARAGEIPDAAAADVVAYDAYCRAVTRAADEYYRRTALGAARADELPRVQLRLARALWSRLAWPAGAPRYFPTAADSEIARRFGAVWEFGTTAGYPDLHYGHRIGEERRVVRQYGHTATVRFVALDGIVSNGFQTWAWDGRGAHAGWQFDATVVQVRPAFAQNPVALWELETDSVRASAAASALASDSAADAARLASPEAIAYLPGVAQRIARDGRRALLDSLRGAGLSGDDLRQAFVHEIARTVRDAALFAHEGRHAIDASIRPPLPPVELEYRAKLAEVAFAPRPRLALGAILHPSVGDATPHGQANARVLRGVAAWMREHATEIRGFDAARPTLLQLPLLDDAQLRAAFRSLDPLARTPPA